MGTNHPHFLFAAMHFIYVWLIITQGRKRTNFWQRKRRLTRKIADTLAFICS